MMKQQVSQVGQRVSSAMLSALAPLALAGALAPAAVLLPMQSAQAQQVENLLIQRSLRLGDRGADVLQLQQALIQRGLLNISIPRNAREGYFGPATRDALRDFQLSYSDLPADGVLGEDTFRRLFGVGATRTQAYSIALMQAQLSELGYYNSRLDGEFGPITERALSDLRDEAFIELDTRPSRLENTFAVVSDYYDERRQTQDLPHSDVLESRIERQLPRNKLYGFSLGNGRFSNGNFNRRPVAVAPASVSDQRFGDSIYRAIVPLNRESEAAKLSSLRRFVDSLQVAEDDRGLYAQVGAYGDRQNAEKMVTYLRNNGFDARVIYN